MCGINGLITADIDFKRKIKEANDLIRHRGPDDEGYVFINTASAAALQFSGKDSPDEIKKKFPILSFEDTVGEEAILAHRRLSIIDLSASGHCPMSDKDGKIWLTYNGEIYNYIELREELKNAGFNFRTASDTEVIINSYLHWGTQCLSKFNGMWSFAIWDSGKKRLLLARDRFGVKPLYYTKEHDYFAFSSEMKPLAVYRNFDTAVNKKKIPFYLIYGNRLNSNDTYLEGINSLPASHYLTYENGRTELVRYYDVPSARDTGGSDSEIARSIVELLEDSIKLRFRSDVPVGTCLSGGFDSSSIVSLASDAGENNIETFSAVWNEMDCDESYYIDIVNERFKCSANKVIPQESEFAEVFQKLCYYQEIPTEGPGLYPQWYVMQKAKEKVKVLLDGQGGDEVFGGYFQMGAYLRGVLRDKNIFRIAAESPNFMKFFNKNGLHSFTSWLFPRQYGYMTRSKLSARFSIINSDLLNQMDRGALYFDVEPTKKLGSYLGSLSYHFIRNMTIPALLHYEDRSSMAHSLESRVPFLDYRLVELGVNLSSKYLAHKGVSRPLYRKALKPYLPEEVVNRKDKLGFPVPFAEWTHGSLKNMINDELLSSNTLLFDYVDKQSLINNLDAHFSKTRDYSWEIWRLLSLNNFLKLFSGKTSILAART
ncbi:MAG TPA: asparagine synthase (glutamine-hydrolyzing) [Ignavibacteria bacterium]|nr:asparagine synthase (glutamine-hydrolyzing) [Ignavibacteria bacterium]HMQ99173.1 asparagine synthase (glutamine-hydrolyzing) [Ignavibacteria bacterium]